MPGRGRVVLELLAQAAHVHRHRGGVAVGITPDSLQQLLPTKRTPRTRRQEHDEVELAGRERHGNASLAHVVGRDLDAQIPGLDLVGQLLTRRHRSRGSTQDRLHASGELTRRERLGDVVVRAELQTHHAVVFVASGGEHDHRHRRVLPQAPADLETVDPGQHEVEDHEVRPLSGRVVERGLAVTDRVHRETLALEVAHNDLTHCRIILDDEHVRWRDGHHGDRIAISIANPVATWSASHARRAGSRASERAPSAAVASSTQPTNGSQIRSTSAFDMPLISAKTMTNNPPPASSQTRRSRSHASATATAGPSASANAPTLPTTKYSYGRRPATPA